MAMSRCGPWWQERGEGAALIKVHSYETRSQQCVRVALAEEFKIKQNKKKGINTCNRQGYIGAFIATFHGSSNSASHQLQNCPWISLGVGYFPSSVSINDILSFLLPFALNSLTCLVLLYFYCNTFLALFSIVFFKGIVRSITLTVKCFLSPVKLILNRLNRFCERSEVPFHECTIRTFEK